VAEIEDVVVATVAEIEEEVVAVLEIETIIEVAAVAVEKEIAKIVMEEVKEDQTITTKNRQTEDLTENQLDLSAEEELLIVAQKQIKALFLVKDVVVTRKIVIFF